MGQIKGTDILNHISVTLFGTMNTLLWKFMEINGNALDSFILKF